MENCPKCGMELMPQDKCQRAWRFQVEAPHGAILHNYSRCLEVKNSRKNARLVAAEAKVAELTAERDTLKAIVDKRTVAAAKALCELEIVLPYLPLPTNTIAKRVFNDILRDHPDIPHRDFCYCPQCYTVHKTDKHTPDAAQAALEGRE